MFILSDLVSLINSKLRGRTDLVDQYPMWANSIALELSQNYEFEELKLTGPTLNFVIGQSEYKLDTFLLPNTPIGYNNITTFFRYFTTNNPPLLNQTGSVIEGRSMAVVEPMRNLPGLPMFWAQHGNVMVVGFSPDQEYAVYMRYQRKHPPVKTLADVLFFPNDWDDILATGIAIKGCEFAGMNDISVEYFKKLHGDPKEPESLGLIKGRVSQQRRNMNNNARRLNVTIKRY